MPFETKWLVDDKLLYQRFYGDVTVEEYIESVGIIGRLLAEHSSSLIHAIADVLDVQRHPSAVALSRHRRKTRYNNVGWTIIVVTNPVTRFVTHLLAQFAVRNLHSVLSLQEALDFLAARGVEIPE